MTSLLLHLLLVAVCVLMPLAMAWRVWRIEEKTRAAWLVTVADAMTVTLVILMVGRWDIVGFYTRFVLMALLAVAIVLSVRRHASRPWPLAGAPSLWRSHWSTFLSLIPFGAAALYAGSAYFGADAARPLAFPLEGGRFMVAHGSGNRLLNNHAGHREQHHAADIVAINAAGFRADGLLPDDPARYVVWEAPVVSPCAGTVVEAEDGLPDLPPPRADPEHPPGNHVVIACDGLQVELAHLRQGSLAVAAGDRVAAGERIGAVGNSGNTTEPHLHIHAVDAESGAGVPISFDGVIPTRNRTFRG